MKQFFLLLASGLLLILLQIIPWNVFFPEVVTFNLSLAFVAFIALYYTSLGSWLLAFVLGYVLEALSGSPSGLLILINLSSLLIIRGSNRFLLFESLASQVSLVFFLSLLVNLFFLVVMKIAITNPVGLIAPGLFTNCALTTVLSIPLFIVYNKRRLSSEG